MSGLLKPGHLVTPSTFGTDDSDRVALYSDPSSVVDLRVVGWLSSRDVALVVALLRADGAAVYVIGPNGSGWTHGAVLTIVRKNGV